MVVWTNIFRLRVLEDSHTVKEVRQGFRGHRFLDSHTVIEFMQGLSGQTFLDLDSHNVIEVT